LTVRAPVVTLKAAVVAFAATVTDAGAVNAGDPLFPNVTTAPPAGAACDNVTVQVALPFEAIVDAVHVKPLIVAGATEPAVTVPPVADSDRAVPANDALTGFPTPIVALFEPEARVTETVATTPFAMRSDVSPAATQI
jgi:hypothetical protein